MRRWLALGLTLAAAGLAVWFATRPKPREDGDIHPNLLVIDIDTLAADRVGGTSPDGQPVTPNLDRFAAEGARFTHAYSSSGWTLPALVSILGGRWPQAVEVERGEAPVAPERDLPKLLGMYGYHTVGAWGDTLAGAVGDVISRSFTERLPKGPHGDAVIRWLEEPKEPFFLYVHEVDLHSPGPVLGASRGGWRAIHAEGERSGEGGEAAVLARYDAQLTAYDAVFGRILEALDDVADRTVVIVTSDHGQDFFTHAFVDHGVLYDSTLHVPLVIRDPRGPRRVTIDRMVQTLDLAPTLLARVGVPLDTEMKGQPLAPLLGGDGTYEERPVYSLSERCHVSLRTKDTKVLLRDGRPRSDRTWVEAGGENGARVTLAELAAAHDVGALPDCGSAPNAPTPADLIVELYDLVADPEETHSLIQEDPERGIPLLVELLSRMGGGAERAGMPLTEEQKRTIQAQGYWGMMNPGEGR